MFENCPAFGELLKLKTFNICFFKSRRKAAVFISRSVVVDLRGDNLVHLFGFGSLMLPKMRDSHKQNREVSHIFDELWVLKKYRKGVNFRNFKT